MQGYNRQATPAGNTIMLTPKNNHKNTLSIILILVGLVAAIACYLIFADKQGTALQPSNNSSYDDYRLFEQAINLATNNTDEALVLCKKSGMMTGNCLTEIAKISAEKDIGRSVVVCESISDKTWKNECFSVISAAVFSKNLSLASEICELSEKLKYSCYHNMGIFVAASFDNLSSAAVVCREVPTQSIGDCFFGFGISVGRRFLGNNNLVVACDETPVEFRYRCFSGFGHSFGIDFGNISIGISACNEIPSEFRGDCFSDFVGGISKNFINNINPAISACNEIPAAYSGKCLVQLSFSTGYSGFISLCNQFKEPYNFICTLGFGEGLGEESSKESEKCDIITNEVAKEWCYKGFGRGLGERFSDNISLAVSICNSSSSGVYNFDCYSGIIDTIANLFSEIDSFSVLDKCGRAGKFSSYCFERVGKKSVEVYNYNLSKSFNVCYELNESFRNSCFTGIGKGLGEQFLYNPSLASMKCEELPSPYNANCKQGIDETIKFYNISS